MIDPQADKMARHMAIAERLLEWMWSQRPPVNRKQFADLLNDTDALHHAGTCLNSTISSWTSPNQTIIPDVPHLAAIAEVTRSPLAEWYALAGIPVPLPAIAADPGLDAAIARMRADDRFTPAEREAMADYFRAMWAGVTDPLAARRLQEATYGAAIAASAQQQQEEEAGEEATSEEGRPAVKSRTRGQGPSLQERRASTVRSLPVRLKPVTSAQPKSRKKAATVSTTGTTRRTRSTRKGA